MLTGRFAWSSYFFPAGSALAGKEQYLFGYRLGEMGGNLPQAASRTDTNLTEARRLPGNEHGATLTRVAFETMAAGGTREERDGMLANLAEAVAEVTVDNAHSPMLPIGLLLPGVDDVSAFIGAVIQARQDGADADLCEELVHEALHAWETRKEALLVKLNTIEGIRPRALSWYPLDMGVPAKAIVGLRVRWGPLANAVLMDVTIRATLLYEVYKPSRLVAGVPRRLPREL